jgi:hypothetical protein
MAKVIFFIWHKNSASYLSNQHAGAKYQHK